LLTGVLVAKYDRPSNVYCWQISVSGYLASHGSGTAALDHLEVVERIL
jgi:hypothetical protein